jgi:hypothetical protein
MGAYALTIIKLQRSGGRKLCVAESLVMQAWEYNWTAPPSQCCKKRLPHA